MRAERLAAILLASIVGACGSGGGGGSGGGASVGTPAVGESLSREDVQRIVAQAAGEALARGKPAQISVVDRVGNVLATFEMTGAVRSLEISSGLGVSGGLDGVILDAPAVNYAAYSAVSKAVTGAYLSSGGNAFSTRTAGQIIQEHFNPQEAGQPSGPLYGVQFSQLRCSDVISSGILNGSSLGPRPAPFGLSADPGGLPLYKNGQLVGGIGVEADGRYGFDRDITDRDDNVEEAIALAGSSGFAAPTDIRGDRITADGRTFRYVDTEALVSDPARAAAFGTLPGRLDIVIGFTGSSLRAGAAFGSPESGIAAGPNGAWILVGPDGTNRYPARDGLPGGSAGEVQAILDEALAVARRARAQIRRPLGSAAQVSIAVVNERGDIVGLIRTPDAPVFGIDVAVQKARTASFFSSPAAAATLATLPPVDYAPRASVSDPRAFIAATRAFLADPTALTGSTAYSARAIGNLHRPFFPDGVDGAPNGPFSTPFGNWSPFNPGLQLDLVFGQLVQGTLNADDTKNCVQRGALPGPSIPDAYRIANGIQIFPGGVPIYRNGILVGGLGVSGDGVDQDDMIAFLGLHNAGLRLASGLGNAPAGMRADQLSPLGTRLRYVQCPQSPFLDSTEQNVCAGK
jgi:uncharacterized protein GlcG (DUF336 family)